MKKFVPSIENLINDYLSRPDYRPLNRHALIKALGLPPESAATARTVLREMEQRGAVTRLRGNRWAPATAAHRVTGRLRVHARGFAFVEVEPPPDAKEPTPDLFIPEGGLQHAIDGDLVEVEPCAPSGPARGRPGGRRARGGDREGRSTEARLVRVVARDIETVVGLVQRTPYYAYVIPDDPRIPQNIKLNETEALEGLPVFHKVVVRLDAWTPSANSLSGTVVEDLGAADAPGTDIRCLIRQYHLSEEFPAVVLREEKHVVKGWENPMPEADADRRDLRAWRCFTIDPADARDFDDAVSLDPLEDGCWRLGVHIADVSAYVAPGSAIDREAAQRGNTIYLVDRAISMLPPTMTLRVCSLQPDSDRRCHSAIMVLDAKGAILSCETCPTTIRSCAQMTYDQVQSLFDGKAEAVPPVLRDPLLAMRRLARRMRARRRQAGALDFTLPEVYCELDPVTEAVVAIHKRESREAYQLIEEFMLAANRSVAARFAATPSRTGLYRIHEEPEPEQWEQIHADLAALGIDAVIRTSADINALSKELEDSPLQHAVSLSVLRNLKRARYSEVPSPHFGLAFPLYTHFTSPIRRYPDLVVHRLLKAMERRAPLPYNTAALATLAAHCSNTEDAADRASSDSVDVKRIAYYAQALKTGQTGPFEAVVVNLIPKGLLVESTDTLQRGLVAFAGMEDDYYEIQEGRQRAVGRRRRGGWTIGDRVQVELIAVDSHRRLVDFRLAAKTHPARGDRKKKGRIETRKKAPAEKPRRPRKKTRSSRG